eukprot:GHVR01116451.1.p1 GENE.GHVR01116451.1~~GHVR01116451.1.p1  ORF type:complete len:105 (+),score=5.36 GHVR01116451.1:4610-4924(+)
MYEGLDEGSDDVLSVYLKGHTNKTNIRLHMIGLVLAILIIIEAIVTFSPFDLIWALVLGFGLSWIGHYCFEKNKPGPFTLTNLTNSIKANFILMKQIVMRKRSF